MSAKWTLRELSCNFPKSKWTLRELSDHFPESDVVPGKLSASPVFRKWILRELSAHFPGTSGSLMSAKWTLRELSGHFPESKWTLRELSDHFPESEVVPGKLPACPVFRKWTLCELPPTFRDPVVN